MSSVEIRKRPLSPLQRVNTKGFSHEAEWISEELDTSRTHFTATFTTRTNEQRFKALKEKWERDTLYSSSSNELLTSPAYLEIISMGKDALPLIFEDLKKEPKHWFMALKIIAGVDPVPRVEKGRIDLMRQKWLEWGKDNHYVA